MAYAHKVNRVTISGTSFQGAEIWSTGFFLGAEAGDAPAVTVTAPEAVFNLWKTFFIHAQSEISWSYVTTQVKIAGIGTDGKTIEDQVFYHNPSSAPAGGKTSNGWPAQISLVATLQSSIVRGLASKGRMFIPGVQTNMTAGGKADPTQLGIVADKFNTFLSGLNLDPGVPGKLINASFGHKFKIGENAEGEPIYDYTAGVNKVVDWVKIGDVYDTQRRRRNSLTEGYTTRNVAD
jgi:hypothetical protein